MGLRKCQTLKSQWGLDSPAAPPTPVRKSCKISKKFHQIHLYTLYICYCFQNGWKKLMLGCFFSSHHDNGEMDGRFKYVTFESNQCTEQHNVHVCKT